MVIENGENFVDQEGISGDQCLAAGTTLEPLFKYRATRRQVAFAQIKRSVAVATAAGSPGSGRQRRIERTTVDNFALPSGLGHHSCFVAPRHRLRVYGPSCRSAQLLPLIAESSHSRRLALCKVSQIWREGARL